MVPVVVAVENNTFPPHSAAAAAGDNTLVAEADNILVAVGSMVVVGPGWHSRQLVVVAAG